MLKKIVRKIKKAIKLFKKPFKDRIKSESKRLRSKYASYYNKYKVKHNIVLYESSFGRGMICNPYAIFTEFMRDELFNKYIHIWVLEEPEEHQPLIEEYKKYSNVIFVKRQTNEYLKYLVSAKYLINNTSFSAYFAKKKDQVFIDTWHSITVKTLGFDMPDGRTASGNMLRNLLAADYIISANKFTTKIFKNSYKLDGLYKGKIIEEGHPRNDLVVNTPKEIIVKKLLDNGVAINPTKKTVLYAPTWKGKNFFKPEFSVDEYMNVINKLRDQINTDEYQILVKPHPTVYNHMKDNKNINEAFVPANIDTNELLSTVDILISDYSSIYLDFMMTDRSILFYIPDIEEYQDYRGMYFKIEDLPGPATKKLDDICKWINNINDVKTRYKDIYSKTKAWACEYDNGNVSKKIIDIVFKQKDSNYNIVKDFNTHKNKVLMYGGGLKMNGVTFSLLSLLNMIDYNKFDISLIVFNIKDKTVLENVYKVNNNVRVFCRVSTYNATLFEDIRDQYVKYLGIGKWYLRKLFPHKMYKREFSRCFGDSYFNYIVDFSGYGPFFNFLMMQAKDAKRIIWQHSDLSIDIKRTVKGKKKQYQERSAGIRAAISLYNYYDKIVSCSKALMEVNRDNLSTKYTRDKFTYATNITNFNRVIDGLKAKEFIEIEGNKYLIAKKEENNCMKLDLELLQLPLKSTINFVTMGRLSPEKNQPNLIIAFAQLYSENKNCRLYIIG